MNEYTVELSGDAQADVISIRDYIRDVLLNPSAASKFVSDTKGASLSLRTFPYSHMVRPGNDGLYFPAEATGKNIHTYIDDEMQGQITDYNGVIGTYHELSGVHLGGADYSLSLSRLYADYIKGVQYE